MSYFKTKKFQITATVIFGLIILVLMMIGIEYIKVSRIIKNFEKDFKWISESKEFKEFEIMLKSYKLAFFRNFGERVNFCVQKFDNYTFKF
ncbi:hypothetical protein CWI39_2644p0010 [Hamiltosporidium magnivora]|uniref:Uncharacterized protein n=1 Tax=Hamiltosporidium magnivora TaxID=148818 RepID=A0A4Q9KTV1_9MICR|nr:hypothetical protein CWI39_2644p0010 [Hamiltosporidium magnivora]